jgi:hypothetical protein
MGKGKSTKKEPYIFTTKPKHYGELAWKEYWKKNKDAIYAKMNSTKCIIKYTDANGKM